MQKLIIAAVALAAVGIGVVTFGGTEPVMPKTVVDPAERVATISHGERVDLDEHLAPGTWTIVEFTADW